MPGDRPSATRGLYLQGSACCSEARVLFKCFPFGECGNPATLVVWRFQDGICVGGENDHRIAENVYASLNTEKPADYHARTFSMGDILVLSDEDRNEKAYFCDTFGFVEVPEFLS